ncbi:MAG: right-handed parallel beta-helix repeat-containing protein [Desulfobulbaceae bacterium]
MNRKQTDRLVGTWAMFLFALAVCALSAVNARAFTVNVVDPAGAPITGGFRWLLEEDNTNVTVPGVPVRVSISTDIHNSHAPVVNSGQAAGGSADITVDATGTALDSSKRYFVSVLPDSGYSISGTVVEAPNPAAVTVTVNPLPLPTAQISLFAFVDHNPINNVFDEHDQGLGGATVIISDGAGQLMQDAFGNPLGTQYAFDPGTGQAIVDVDGNPQVTMMGTGVITTLTQEQFDAGGTANPYNLRVGEALIKYLVPGKYGVRVVPPGFDDAGIAMTWSQTSTIEGTPTVDAWVKANEPKLFVEGFGTGFNHVFYGFVKVSPATSNFKGQTFTTLEWNQAPVATATGTITGTLRANHFSRPPTLQGYFPGITVPSGWVGLNDPLVQPGDQAIAVAGKIAVPCNEDGSFVINNVPPGTYQLVTWDANLDYLFGFYSVTVPPGPDGTGGVVALGDVLNFRWFGALENYVFYDADEDGFRDPGEPGIPEQNVNLRFRDGTIYQAFPTDRDGFVPFDEVFPFFKWLVVEVDFARFKASGMTTAVDYGGPIPGPDWPANGNKNPQPQNPADPFNEYGTLDYRTETGPVLTQAMHLFLGQTNLIEWGKSTYKAGENGGISGIVFYAVTRAENDPRYAAGDGWEPGIPRVQVNLYEDRVINATGLPGSDGVIDDIDDDATVTRADVDNYPFQWAPIYQFLDDGVTPNPGFTGIRGPEDIDRDLSGTFGGGDAVQIATTDSWDDSKPSGCIQDLPVLPAPVNAAINECADSFGTWNQVRPGVFDGGYAFDSYYPAGITSGTNPGQVGSGAFEVAGLPSGVYIVEAVPPPGYKLLKEEDKNVDFGDTFIPSPLLLPPVCVGDPRIVPDFMSFDGVTPAPFAGQSRPLCDRKQVTLGSGQNAAADFFLFTQVPKAARAVGFVNNDLGAEFNQASPIYGEKLAAAWIPISFRDWQGKELVRVYADEFGGYNALLPSTYTVNVPSPTGVSPSMITLVLNDPYLADGVTPDPYYDPDYAVTPWTLNYMPGATSYLDTPIVPVTAFAANDVRLDTGPANGTPVIHAVTTDSQAGPLVCTDTNPLPATVTINAPPGGTITIRNPDYPTFSSLPTITRDVGFGTGGSVTLDNGIDPPVVLPVVSWTNTQIQVTVDGVSTGRLMVTRDNGLVSEVGVTLNILDCSGLTVHTVAAGGSVQAAIDDVTTVAGDIILVGTGAFNENVIMYKPVRLQGSGAGSVINANPIPLDRLDVWHARVDALGAQEFIAFLLKNPFSAGETPGVFVVGETAFPGGNLQNPDNLVTQYLNQGNLFSVPGQAAIDGFTILGSKAGGGIFAVSGAYGLEISNNNITNNQGNFAGGIAIGTPDSGFPADSTGRSLNQGVVIRHNKIHRNGGIQGGGGIALNEGSEGYLVEENLIIGNFGRHNGGGIQHRGLSIGDNVIRGNRIIFNEIFFGALLALAGDGAGIYVGGDTAGGTGSGSVTIDSNLIQGNMTGSGNGGGIRAFAMNAQDVRDFPADDTTWYRLNIFNNIIVNNVAGNSGAGISLQDVARANIVNNTIANNDSTATSALAFQAGQANSTPQPAGIASALHSTILQGLFGLPEPTYSNPLLVNNIIWQNRSWYNDASLNAGAGGLAVNPAGPYWDLHVLGSVADADPHLNPDYCIFSSLTDPVTGFDYTAGGADTTNSQSAPGLVAAYFNALESTTVVDEGGNAINIRFTPLTTSGSDYHIGSGQAFNTGSDGPLATFPELALDFDREGRPFETTDVGADELQAAPLLAPLSWNGKKGNPSLVGTMSPLTNTPRTNSITETPAPFTARVITGRFLTRIDAMKEKLARIWESIVPGRSHSAGPDSDGTGSRTISLPTGDVPGVATENNVPASTAQPPTKAGIQGADVLNPVNSAPAPRQEGEGAGRSFSSPGQGKVSLPGNGAERGLPAARADQPGTDLGVARQQGESNSTVFRYVLIGLTLSGLAFIFFIVIMPKTKKRREQ